MVICAWCDDEISALAPAPAQTPPARSVSHGICRACLADQLAALSAMPAAGAAPSAPLGF